MRALRDDSRPNDYELIAVEFEVEPHPFGDPRATRNVFSLHTLYTLLDGIESFDSPSPYLTASNLVATRTGIEFTWHNEASVPFGHGEPWYLLYYYDGAWRPVPYVRGLPAVSWRMPEWTLPAGASWEISHNWEHKYGRLPNGRYAFFKEGGMFGSVAYFMAVFEITD